MFVTVRIVNSSKPLERAQDVVHAGGAHHPLATRLGLKQVGALSLGPSCLSSWRWYTHRPLFQQPT